MLLERAVAGMVSTVVRSIISVLVEEEVAPTGAVVASAEGSMACRGEVGIDACGHGVGREVGISCLALSRIASSCDREREGEGCTDGEGLGQ